MGRWQRVSGALVALALVGCGTRTARPEQFVDNRLADELARAGLFEGP